jgi:2OG-Fe(II) oxygenase superfamily
MNSLSDWINEYYLLNTTIANIRESIIAKPSIKYVVLDNFFNIDKLDMLIERHNNLRFEEKFDKYIHTTGELLPYDSSVVFAQQNINFGSDLFFNEEWHRYLANLSCCNINFPTKTEVKLRRHRPNANGFWIHTDSLTHCLVAICYFNKDWKVSDGGLLQLWRVDEAFCVNTPVIECSYDRLDVLTKYKRIRTSTPGGGFADSRFHDMVLIDQIVPIYNRLFLCNYQGDPAYHSITPSFDRERLGFVQWLGP